MICQKRAWLLVVLWVAVLPGNLSASQPVAHHPHILILNSYHPGFVWSDDELTGVLQELRRRYPLIDPAIEYLDANKIPTYATHGPRLGHGIVEGILLDGKEPGRRAGEIALRVLAGDDPAHIPVDTKSTARRMFDGSGHVSGSWRHRRGPAPGGG